MKGWQVALLCLAIAALAVFGTLLFIRQTEEKAPPVDIPRYTADQVIAVAKAYPGEECGGSIWSGSEPYDASWTTVYLGDGKWKVTKYCRGQYRWETTPTLVSEWTFYEATGELKPS
jgi:hypothetical protein